MTDSNFFTKSGSILSSGSDSEDLGDLKDHANETGTPPDLVLIGGNCHVKGEIRNCRRLEIEGRLEGDFETEEIIVQNGGNINGKLKTKNAEIHGTIEGELVVEELLDIRETGTVSGDVDYGKLAVETGGQLTGSLKNKGNTGSSFAKSKKETSSGVSSTASSTDSSSKTSGKDDTSAA